MNPKPRFLILFLILMLAANLTSWNLNFPDRISGNSIAQVQPTQVETHQEKIADGQEGIGAGEAGAGEGESENEQYYVPTNPNAHPESVVPGDETVISEVSLKAPAAAGDFTIYKDGVIPLAATGNNIWMVAEPSIGSNGRIIYLSGNKFASVSGDYGNTWTWVDPFTKFPVPAGLSQFCCDQSVFHDRTHNMTFWLLQYHRVNPTVSGHNAITLAVAHGQKETFDGTWTTYTITPQQTEPVLYAAENWWFDYPDVAVSNNYLYITINPNNLTQDAVAFRLSLDTLAAGAALPNPWPHFIAPQGFLRPTQGATDTMYFVQHIDNMTLRLWTWPEATPSPTYVDRTVNAWNNTVAHATCADGNNWLAYSLNVVQAAWVAAGKIGAMWNSAEGGGFAYPQVRWALFNLSGLGLFDQGEIFSPNFAWAFPSANINDRGEVGGTIGAGCGNNSGAVQLQAWLSDSINGNVLQPLENVTVAVGTNGPADHRWGDYYVTRRMVPYSNTFLGTGIVMNGGSDSLHTAVHFVWFGREQDRPPTNNTIYGNSTNNTAYQDGTILHPFQKAGDSCYASIPGDTVILQAGTYTEPGLLISRSCFINSSGGSAIIK